MSKRGLIIVAILAFINCKPAYRDDPSIKSEIEDLGNGITLEMVFIAGGSFIMGNPEGKWDSDEYPQHQVTLSPFYIGRYEVTQAQWKVVMGNNPSHFQGDNLPVEQVSWEDAQEFCRRLSQKTGKKYRLPTEAEWEYAARAGTTGDYAGDINSMGWHRDNSGGRTHAVGNKAPNAWGLYDMHGNVWEWCQDWYEKYKADPVKDPIGPSQGSLKVFRGGSWNFEEPFCRSADRNWSTPDLRFYDLGFRLARN